MIADWSVEVSEDSPLIAVPWELWADLRPLPRDPGDFLQALQQNLPEVRDYPELAPLLRRANTAHHLSSKVDVFPITRDEADPEIAEAGETETQHGLCSYLDLLTTQHADFLFFEQAARNAVTALSREQAHLCAVEVVVRPARLYDNDTFAWTLYAMGFGTTALQARQRWAHTASLALAALLEHLQPPQPNDATSSQLARASSSIG